MIHYCTQLSADLDKQIARIEAGPGTPVDRYAKARELVLKALVKIKERMFSFEYLSQEEEITFFKFHKPDILSKFIFYNKLYYLELHRLGRSPAGIRKYCKEMMTKIDAFFRENEFIITYFRSGQQQLDYYFFLRKKDLSDIPRDTLFPELDHRFSTNYDLKIAKLLAYEQLEQHLEKILEKTETKKNLYPEHTSESKGPLKTLKSHQVERILGISSGTLQTLRNNGTIPFTKIGGICYYDEHEIRRLLSSGFKNNSGD